MSEYEPLTNNEALQIRLQNWVNERRFWWPPNIKTFFEWNARRVVRDSILHDLSHEISPAEVDERTKTMLKNVEKFANGRDSCQINIGGKEGAFQIRLSRIESGWSIGEFTPSGACLSKAVIHNAGHTFLTLDYPEMTSCNPNITAAYNFPTATIKVFALLAGHMMRESGFSSRHSDST